MTKTQLQLRSSRTSRNADQNQLLKTKVIMWTQCLLIWTAKKLILGRSEFSLGAHMIACFFCCFFLFCVVVFCVFFWPVEIKIVNAWGLFFTHIKSI